MICQLTENLLPGDAISDHVRALDGAMRELGYDTALCVGQGGGTVHVRDLPGALGEKDLLLYEYSIGSPLNEWFAAQHCKKAIVYQNITPPEFFEPYDARLADAARWGRQQLREILPTLSFALASSEYSAGELRGMGCGDVSVLPILLDGRRYEEAPDENLLQKLSDGKKNILFVGRKAPNKRIEDVLLAADYYAAATHTPCRVVMAGDESMTRYCRALRELAAKLSVELLWLGRVPMAQLIAADRGSHLFLCMSEPEGFCVPLLESMLFDLPVLAFDAAAVPETLGGSGVVFRSKSLPELARVMDALLFDEALRQEVVASQRRRLENFKADKIRDTLGRILKDHGFFPELEKGAVRG